MSNSSFLSLRSQLLNRCSKDADLMTRVLGNPYEPDVNPQGIINFGTALNGLMDDIWIERFSTNPFIPNSKHFRYYEFWGTKGLRKNIAAIMTAIFKPNLQLIPDNIFLQNGAIWSLDNLSYILADSGDVFLCPVPGYTGYFDPGTNRWGINFVPIKLKHNSITGELFHLSITLLEEAIAEQSAMGKKVKGLIFNNPHNPTGKVFNRNIIVQLMIFCEKYNVHLIADEMYATTEFDGNDFCSVLEIYSPKILKPELFHVIWGFSKDLCLTSFRAGIFYTNNPAVKEFLTSGHQFAFALPLPIMDILENVTSDIAWIQDTFIPENKQRIKQAYDSTVVFLKSLNIPFYSTTSGYFILIDLSSLLVPCNETRGRDFLEKLIAQGVYLTPWWDMRADPGLFRLVFTAYTYPTFHLGLSRLEGAIKGWNS